jgi:hypothetical protein
MYRCLLAHMRVQLKERLETVRVGEAVWLQV